jgi:curved DNA-binding protein CbpA
MIDPYGVLGVAGDAEFEAIRAAYRRLVRENHPDVASDKVAATVAMARINEAWRLLGAPEKRAHFDEQVKLRGQEAKAQQESEDSLRLENQRRMRLQREKQIQSRRSRSQKGEKSRSSKSTPSKKSDTLKQNAKSSNPSRDLRLIRKLALASQLFHREGKIEDASSLCRSVLLADGRNVQARELLADILAYQGRLDSALMMLDQAVQIAPQDQMLRRKRDRMHVQQHRISVANFEKGPRLSLMQRIRACFLK